jgi:hypothetical protein
MYSKALEKATLFFPPGFNRFERAGGMKVVSPSAQSNSTRASGFIGLVLTAKEKR